MTAPYDHEVLWAKAKVFLNRAMDPAPDRSFDEQALWASAALELLAKAALARVSPLLIAEPTEDGLNILIATGLVQGNAQFTSVKALQQRLLGAGMQSFFSTTDDHILLDVYVGSETVTVQVAEPDEGRESFAWQDSGGGFHREPPAETLAWLRACAAPPEASKSATRAER